MRRCLLVCGLATLFLLVAVSSASADKPVKFPGPSVTTLLPEGACGFPVQLEVLSSSTQIKIFSNGVVMGTGETLAVLHRLDAAGNPVTSLPINLSGPGKIVGQPDGSAVISGGGPWLVITTAADPIGAGLRYSRGRITVGITPTGLVSSLAVDGNVRDVCADIA